LAVDAGVPLVRLAPSSATPTQRSGVMPCTCANADPTMVIASVAARVRLMSRRRTFSTSDFDGLDDIGIARSVRPVFGGCSRSLALRAAVAAVALPGLGRGLRLLAPIGSERTPDVDLVRGESTSIVASDIALAGARVDEFALACHEESPVLLAPPWSVADRFGNSTRAGVGVASAGQAASGVLAARSSVARSRAGRGRANR